MKIANDKIDWEQAKDRLIRNSAKALIIKDGKMLAIKLQENSEVWYIMPGGGQETEELLPGAACRELAEELGISVAPKELVFVVEGIHGERFHRVDLVFLCEYIVHIPDAALHSDMSQIGFDWLDIETLSVSLKTAQADYEPLCRETVQGIFGE